MLLVVAAGCQTSGRNALIGKYEGLVKSQPTVAEHHLALGALLVRQGKYAQGQRSIKTGKRLWDTQPHTSNEDKIIDAAAKNLLEVLNKGLQKGIYTYDTRGTSMAARMAKMIVDGTQALNNALLVGLERKSGDKLTE
jgi:hypothetical protein